VTTRHVRLRDIAELVRNAVAPSVIGPGCFYVGLEHLDSDGRISAVKVQPGELKSQKFAFGPEHILFGKLRPYLRKIARPGFEGICSTDIVPILTGPDIDRDYLYHQLRSPRLVAFANSRTSGANLPRLNPASLLDLPIVLPPLAEQRRVAAVLDRVERVRGKTATRKRLIRSLREAVFVSMFGDPVQNGRGWGTVTLGELAPAPGAIVDGPFGSSLRPDRYVEAGVRVIRNFNIKDDHFDDSEFKYVSKDTYKELARSDVRPGDILLSSKGTVGNVCVMPPLPGTALLSASGTVRIRLGGESPVRPQFLSSQMVTRTFRAYLKTFEAGTNQRYLNLTRVRAVQIICPPLALQDQFLRVQGMLHEVRRLQVDHFAQSQLLGRTIALAHF